MKRALFLISFALLSLIIANAQSFDEEDLVGTWERSQSMAPVDDYLLSIDSLVLGKYVYKQNGVAFYYNGRFYGKWNEDLSPYLDDTYIPDFYITNGNRLHIRLYVDNTLIFKIKDLTSSSLAIQPIGSNETLYFTKKSTATGISNQIKENDNDNTISYYNVNGQKANELSKGLTIIKPSKGQAYKRINK